MLVANLAKVTKVLNEEEILDCIRTKQKFSASFSATCSFVTSQFANAHAYNKHQKVALHNHITIWTFSHSNTNLASTWLTVLCPFRSILTVRNHITLHTFTIHTISLSSDSSHMSYIPKVNLVPWTNLPTWFRCPCASTQMFVQSGVLG